MTLGNTSSHQFSYFSRHTDQPRKTVAALCLGVSLALHLTAIVLVLAAYTQRTAGPAVTYIDISSIGGAKPAAPMVQSAPQPDENLKSTKEPEPPSTAVEQENPSVSASSAVQDITSTALGRGVAHGYFSSFAEGKNLRNELREYYMALLEKINERWWQKSETLKESPAQDAVVVFMIGKGGEIVELTIRKSTGSREVDRAIIETLKEMVPFPPLPENYAFDSFLVPLKIAAPLKLFRETSR